MPCLPGPFPAGSFRRQMPYIQFQDRQFALGPADVTVGAFEGATVRLPGDDPRAFAVLRVGADGTGIIRRGGADAIVLLNGLQLGQEPSPILHGDKIELGGHSLRYGDDKKGGSTQFISSADLPESLKSRIGTPKKPTTATGGRLVSLVDGREYTVPDGGVVFGREIGCDIVIASTDVSRRHARIAPGEGGYVLSDMSTNGVFVNNSRMDKTQVLGRGDVVKIGPEEFRFYADVAKPPAASASAPAASVPPSASVQTTAPAPVAATQPMAARPAASAGAPPVAAPPDLATMPPLSVPSLSNTAFIATVPSRQPPAPPRVVPPPAAPSAAPLAPSPALPPAASRSSGGGVASRKLLATLEITNEGPTKGTKFEIFTPLTNIGRGPHNDIAINDESVSDSHAKILKREGSWWLVDQESTNGTYVGGRRVLGEQQMVGAPDVRFGGIKMLFRPVASALEDEGKGTRAIAPFSAEVARRLSVARASTAMPKAQGEPGRPVTPVSPQLVEEKKVAKRGCVTMIAFLVTLAAMGATTLVFLLSARG